MLALVDREDNGQDEHDDTQDGLGEISLSKPVFLYFDCVVLKIEVDASTKHLVGTREAVGVVHGDVLSGECHLTVVFLVEILIVGEEICDVHTSVFRDAELGSEAERVTAGDECHVGQVSSIAQSVLRALSSHADEEVLGDVPLHAGQVFLRVGREFLLLALGHLGILVEKVVPSTHHAQGRKHLILCTNSNYAGDVVGSVHTMSEEAGVIALRVVLNVEVVGELQPGTEVELAYTVVKTDDGRDAPSILRAVKVFVCKLRLGSLEGLSSLVVECGC